jgi:hypothetical protein
VQRQFDLDDVQQSLFSQEDRDLLADIAAQASDADYDATRDLLRMVKR